jgi:hypothetical protein
MPCDVVTKRHSKRIRDSVAHNNTDTVHSLLMKLKTIRRDRTDSRVLEVCAGTDFRIYPASPKNIRSASRVHPHMRCLYLTEDRLPHILARMMPAVFTISHNYRLMYILLKRTNVSTHE